MESLTNYLKQIYEADEEKVYVVYFADGIMDNYYATKTEAEQRKSELNKEAPSNKCTVKEEPRTNFEK